MKLARFIKHLLIPAWHARRVFSAADLKAIGAAVSESETAHRGELRFVVEGPLPVSSLWIDESPRQRAIELFARLRVWDTEENCGVLIYVQLVDRRVEILADRGIAAKVPQSEWDAICRGMENDFRARRWREGALAAVTRAGKLLAMQFPAGEINPNELPDAPRVL